MGEIESLLVALGVIYLFECLIWVQRGSVLLVRWWSKSCKIQFPGTVFGNARGALFLANPFPPFGAVFLGRPLPVSFSEDGAFAWSALCLHPGWRPVQTGRFLRFNEINGIEVDGSKVLVNAELFVRASSPYAARGIAKELRHLKKTPVSERKAAIKQSIATALDCARVRHRLDAFAREARWLRHLCTGLFLYLFIAAPLALALFGLETTIWFVLAGLLAQTISIALLFRRAHQTLYPGAEEERFTPFLTMLLAPPTAIRAADLLGRHLFEEFHALAVAATIASDINFSKFARQCLIDLRYPMLPTCPVSEATAVSTEESYREEMSNAIEELARSCGLGIEELLQPRITFDAATAAICPRCQSQFTIASGVCADCGGRPLVRLENIIRK